MKCLPIVLLPGIISGVASNITWSDSLWFFPLGLLEIEFFSPLHAICGIYETEFSLNSKIWGKIQVWCAMLLEVWKKGRELVFRNMAGMLNKNLQKQSPIGVRQYSCAASMHQIYRKMPMRKCDFNKVGVQLSWNHTSVWVLSCIFAAYLRNTFLEEHLWQTASKFVML